MSKNKIDFDVLAAEMDNEKIKLTITKKLRKIKNLKKARKLGTRT